MRIFFKYFSALLLWLAWLTISAHQIIPHDHHITDQYSNHDNDCPASGSKSDHKPGFPIHCHAFNDLASEKARIYNFLQDFRFSFIELSIITDPDTFNLQVSCIRISDFQKPLSDSFALELSLLRAPPVLA
jgi:hypothetical protein